MNPLTPFIAWLNRRRRIKALATAERRRAAIARQIEHRKAHRAEWRPLVGDYRSATNASLAASCGMEWRG